MIGVDTNLLVRFLVKDIEVQAHAVNSLLDKGEIFFINQVVLCELSWVLLTTYGYTKIEFIKVLDTLFEIEGFEFFDQQTVKHAIKDYINNAADFNDCLVNQINQKRNLETFTFDKKAAKLDGMKLLK